MTITGDGRRVVSVYSGRTLMVWDLETAKPLHALEDHTDTVWKVCAMADGRHVASVSADHTLKVWDLSSYTEVASFPQGAEMQALAVTPDGSRIVVGDRVGRVTCVQFTRGG
jgi:WD40 repeat protein